MSKIKVIGRASNTQILEIKVFEQDHSKILLDFLREKGIPVASTCLGEGICRKCLINDSFLSCKLIVKDVLKWQNKTVFIDYL